MSKSAGAGRRIFRFCAIFPIVLVFVTIAHMADANADAFALDGYDVYHGSCCNGNEMDGVRMTISVGVSSADSDACMINSIGSSSNGGGGGQVEVGDVTCGSNHTLDGTCSTQGGHAMFVETDSNGSYVCYQHGNFTLGQHNTFRVSRIAAVLSGDVDYAAYINGTKYQASFMTTTDKQSLIYVFAWGEISTSGSTACESSDHDSASYFNIERYNYFNDNFYALNSMDHGYRDGCFNVSGYANQQFQLDLNL